MASDDSKKNSKFWLGITDSQDDIRVLFHNRQEARRGAKAPVSSGFWLNITGQQLAERNDFFEKQGARRGIKPPEASGFWQNLTEQQVSERKAFFERQATLRGAAAPESSGFWQNITDQQLADREAFFKAQAARREANAPGASGFWQNLTEQQQADREAFFERQAERRGIKAPEASGFWQNLTAEQQADRAAFFKRQKEDREKARTRKAEDGSTRWPGITTDQFAKRAKFFTDQKALQEYKNEQRKKPPAFDESGAPVKIGSSFWSDITEKQHRDRAAYRKRQEDLARARNAPIRIGIPVSGSDFFTDITVDKRRARGEFERQQAQARAPSNLSTKKTEQKIKLRADAAKSTSSQWSRELVYDFHVAVVGLGLVMEGFRKVTGVGTDEITYETYREGGDNFSEHFLINQRKNERIVLEWAIRHPDPFQLWFLTVGTGVIISQPVVITLLERKIPRAMWVIPQAMIAKIDFPLLDAMNSEVATNKVELIHNGLIPIPM
ncbi:MAG: phage tail protein [Oscillospiraceae bacterium]|jgi:phage tail-like protein|nr:phage tail protein [Oscillospiraceae bacterium]